MPKELLLLEGGRDGAVRKRAPIIKIFCFYCPTVKSESRPSQQTLYLEATGVDMEKVRNGPVRTKSRLDFPGTV